MAQLTDLPARIAARVTIHPQSGCWVAGGSVDRDGYARFRHEGLHRTVYRLLVGPIPLGLVLDHVRARGCISRACINPAHLEPVTRRENALRGDSFAAVNARKIHCDHGHPFDGTNTYRKPGGHRDCRSCIRRRTAEYKARRQSRRMDLAA